VAALTDLAAYRTAMQYPRGRGKVGLNSMANLIAGGQVLQSLWQDTNFQGAGKGVAPTTAVVPDNTTQGAWCQETTSSGNLWLGEIFTGADIASTGNWRFGVLMLYDRLSHQGGLSGTATGAQTTNLPTAALTRNTGGVGNQIMVEIYSTIGSSATTLTASYTNQAAASGKTTQAIAWGGGASGNSFPRGASSAFLLPLAAGDTGVQAVASVTAAATTGTVGNFGVSIIQPLAYVAMGPEAGLPAYWNSLAGGGLVPVSSGACIGGLFFQNGSPSSAPVLQIEFSVIQS